MSSPKEKPDARAAAEIRRQKILASRGNRLAKLTNTARGTEGGGVFDNDAPLAALSTTEVKASLSGEEGPSLSPLVRKQGRGGGTAASGPSQFQALPMPGLDPTATGTRASPFAAFGNDSALPSDPFAAMMQAMASGNPPASVPAVSQPDQVSPSQISRWLPVVHAMSIICTLVYAAVVMEPNAWQTSGLWPAGSQLTTWDRWKPLVSERNVLDIQTVPVFYIFLALQLALHSSRLVLEHNVPPPPGLISSVLPYLPPRLQLYIIGGMKYIAIGQQFLDDLGLLVFVLGAVVWLANL